MVEGRRVDRSEVPQDFLAIVREITSLDEDLARVEFYLSEGMPVAILVDRTPEGQIRNITPLGCPLCIRPELSRDAAGRIAIGGETAIPLSAVSNEDPRNPLMSLFAFCPRCGKPVFDHSSARRPLDGMMGRFDE